MGEQLLRPVETPFAEVGMWGKAHGGVERPDEVKEAEAGCLCQITDADVGFEVRVDELQDPIEPSPVEDAFGQRHRRPRRGGFGMVARKGSEQFNGERIHFQAARRSLLIEFLQNI